MNTRLLPVPQACTEMAMPMCTDGVQDMFEAEDWNFQAFSDECNAMFGVRPRAEWAGVVYGGKDLASHSNIIFRYISYLCLTNQTSTSSFVSIGTRTRTRTKYYNCYLLSVV